MQKKYMKIAAMARKMTPPMTPPTMGPVSECFVFDGGALGFEVEVELVTFAS
jgi:hypothetical protein